jgi:hypothetical protein
MFARERNKRPRSGNSLPWEVYNPINAPRDIYVAKGIDVRRLGNDNDNSEIVRQALQNQMYNIRRARKNRNNLIYGRRQGISHRAFYLQPRRDGRLNAPWFGTYMKRRRRANYNIRPQRLHLI